MKILNKSSDHLYRHRIYTNDVIEFVGINSGDEIVYRYIGEEFKDVFLSLKKCEFKKNYERIKKL
jgi:hypothetical protein